LCDILRYGAPAIPQNFNIYNRLFSDTMKLDSLNTRQNYGEWSKLKEMLNSLNKNLEKTADKDGSDHRSFQRKFFVAHYNAMRASCVDNDQLDLIAAKLSVALLRFCDIVPADKAFYEAGVMCQRVKWDNMAFVFLNR
jgi:intraflagellar transport protein 172